MGQFYFGDLPAKWVNIQSALTLWLLDNSVCSVNIGVLRRPFYRCPYSKPQLVGKPDGLLLVFPVGKIWTG